MTSLTTTLLTPACSVAPFLAPRRRSSSTAFQEFDTKEHIDSDISEITIFVNPEGTRLPIFGVVAFMVVHHLFLHLHLVVLRVTCFFAPRVFVAPTLVRRLVAPFAIHVIQMR